MAQQIPEITQSTKFNFFTSIWIVPFIALIIAGWLAYQYFAERGPEIEIIFPVNEGLIAGQSVIKFRNVPVGKVTKIHVSPEIEGIIVTIRMNTNKSKPFLTENARFWIVKPEFGLSGVSGLDTLISGTYINVYSKLGGKEPLKQFIGLSQPYRDSMEGEYFHLISANGDDVSIGMPIYYKNIKVGQVEYVYLSLNQKSVDTIIFIDKQFTALVHDDSKFWIKSMMNVDFTKGNLDINIAPFKFMLQGGIVFSSSGADENATVTSNRIFPIYKSKTNADSQTIGSVPNELARFTLLTDVSTANLRELSPVRFDGFDIGWVDDIEITYSRKLHTMLTKIVIAVDTTIFADKEDVNMTGLENIYEAVTNGLRAKIDALDPISGMLYVDLTFDHNEGNGTIIQGKPYTQLPMVEQSSVGIMNSLSKIMDKVSNLPLDKLVNSLDKVINETSEPIANANEMLIELKKSAKNLSALTGKKSFERMPNEIDKAIKELTRTLRSTRKVVDAYGNDSMLNKQLSYTLEILTKTSKEMEVFLRLLNRKPNSLIFGD